MISTFTIRSSTVNTGAIIGAAISGAVLVFIIAATLLWCILKRKEKKLQGSPIASHIRNPSLSQPPLNRTPRTSMFKAEPPGYTEKNAYFNLASLKESLSPEYTPSISRTSAHHPKTMLQFAIHGNKV
jgi:hypothetical protein